MSGQTRPARIILSAQVPAESTSEDIEQATREAMAALDFWTITAVSVEEANL